MSLPEANVVRERINSVIDDCIRHCLMTAYLYAGRISEVVGRKCLSDNTVARGPKGIDATLETYKFGALEEPTIVFSVKTAKRNGLLRKIAAPLNYEPWAEELLEVFKEAGEKKVFPFTRQQVGKYVRDNKVFEGLTYQILGYKIFGNGKIVKEVTDHIRSYNLHALRHQRATELVEFYGFDGFNLAAYCGWTITTAQAQFGVRTPRVIARYLYLNWQGYFPKLLKKRRA